MATIIRYTEEFKKKVVNEIKKGNQSLEEVSEKYSVPLVLLQNWVKFEDYYNNIRMRYVVKPKTKISFLTKVKTAISLSCQKMKTNNWLLAGCLPLLICLTVFIKCDKIVVESEVNENHHSD